MEVDVHSKREQQHKPNEESEHRNESRANQMLHRHAPRPFYILDFRFAQFFRLSIGHGETLAATIQVSVKLTYWALDIGKSSLPQKRSLMLGGRFFGIYCRDFWLRPARSLTSRCDKLP